MCLVPALGTGIGDEIIRLNNDAVPEVIEIDPVQNTPADGHGHSTLGSTVVNTHNIVINDDNNNEETGKGITQSLQHKLGSFDKENFVAYFMEKTKPSLLLWSHMFSKGEGGAGYGTRYAPRFHENSATTRLPQPKLQDVRDDVYDVSP